jgi:hypothetical protein
MVMFFPATTISTGACCELSPGPGVVDAKFRFMPEEGLLPGVTVGVAEFARERGRENARLSAAAIPANLL